MTDEKRTLLSHFHRPHGHVQVDDIIALLNEASLKLIALLNEASLKLLRAAR